MRIRNWIYGLALGLFTLTLANTAQAQALCGGGSISNTSIFINQSGACTISGNVTATSGAVTIEVTGNIDITGTVSANGGNVYITTTSGTVTIGGATTSTGQVYIFGPSGLTTAAITSSDYMFLETSSGTSSFSGELTSTNNYIYLQSPNIVSTAAASLSAGAYIQVTDGGVQTINLKGTVASGTYNQQGGTILLFAQGNIATGAITLSSLNAAANQAGSLDIKANQGGGNALFTIGGTGQTNGVNGPITMKTGLGGGTQNNFFTGGLFITNGSLSSTGGITLKPGALALQATSSNAPIIFLDAQNGTLTLGSDGLSVPGNTGQSGGVITLLANTIAAPSGALLDAHSPSGANATTHNVVLAAANVTFGSTGLTLNANGGGVSSSLQATANIVPQNSLYIQDTENPTNLLWTVVNNGNPGTYAGPLSIGVGSTGPLAVTANGSNSFVTVSGYPLNVGGGNVLFQSQGAAQHQVYVGYYNGGVASEQIKQQFFCKFGGTSLAA
jgi:hypothetical protein